MAERHQQLMIAKWKHRGLILKEGQTYKDIYSYVMTIKKCERCGINFDDEIRSQRRCMDHNHKTGHFRQVLCMKCNRTYDKTITMLKTNKIGHLWIHPWIFENSGKKYGTFRYRRNGFKDKLSTSLTKLICLSFINLLKEPI
jgi:hypothetical protein